MNAIQSILKDRFDAIERRIKLALNQLDDQQVNWRPNDASNSIANLIVHIGGNVNERIGAGMNQRPFTRNRDEEFEVRFLTKQELIERIEAAIGEVNRTLTAMNDERLSEVLAIGGREQSLIEIFIQSATHFSEHMGQILYIAKLIKDDAYISTTVPKKKAE